jgi:hypothetical protein
MRFSGRNPRGLWHLAPLRIFPSGYPGGWWAFIAISGIIGWLYSALAHRQPTIRWTALSHALFDTLGPSTHERQEALFVVHRGLRRG